jgi:predicted TIM-barrel fold metal-dependent hydrolase
MKYKNLLLIVAFLMLLGACNQPQQENINTDLLVKNFRPESIFNIPKTKVTKAKFPVVDMHSHPYAMSKQEISTWVENMDKFGIERTIILTFETGSSFDSIVDQYSDYPDRFELWCGFDYTGYNEKGWSENAIAELERCYKSGAKGVGELGDKGLGLLYSKPTPAKGMHIDDARLKPVLEKCGELKMPINIHVSEPMWMYEPVDSTNDGLNNAASWHIDLNQKGILNHHQLIQTLENAVRENPNTTFIACHFANCSYDLSIVANLLDNYPNFYADISARYGETAPIPRFMYNFYEKYQDRLFYGTDMGFDTTMYESTFRVLQTADEHFYYHESYNYHWALYGFDLSDEVLKKVYKENSVKLLGR